MPYPAEPRCDLTTSAYLPPICREHIRLFYEYLNLRDVEGCASLIDPEARFRGPNSRVARGPREASALLSDLLPRASHHTLHRIIVDGDGAAVSGTLTRTDSSGRDFADFFSISDHGLLLSWRRFLSVG